MHNEYIESAAYADARSGRLYFCGINGIDCFVADSLDEQLRMAPGELWLNEVNVELTPAPAEEGGGTWPYAVAVGLLMVVSAVGGVCYYKKRGVSKSRPKEEMAYNAVAAESPQPSLPQTKFIEQATAIVNAHIGDADWTAEQMAREMAMSRSKLFTVMKEATGKGVMEFVRDIRLDYAAQKLKEGVPVSEVAYGCGFSEASSFRRSFVKKFGVTPSQYRASES